MKPTSCSRLILALACLLLPAATFAAAAQPAWERLAPLPVGNGGFVGAALGGQIVVAGGTTWQGDTKLWLDQIWAYDPARNTWREAGRLPAAVAYPVSGYDGRALWFAGGSSGTRTHQSLWKLEADLQPRLVGRFEGGFVIATGDVLGGILYAVGGTDDQAATERTGNTFRAIDLATGALTRLPDYPEAGLITGTAAAAGGRLHVFGGGRWDAAQKSVVNHATAHAYSVAARRWEPLPRLPHPGRGYTAVALDERRILIVGGYRNDEVEFVRDTYVFDVARKTYTSAIPLPYAAMVGLVKAGEWLYCIGGEDRKRHRTDAVYRIKWATLLPPNP